MPRRQFVADLAAAVEGASIAGISDVQHGGDDGEFIRIETSLYGLQND